MINQIGGFEDIGEKGQSAVRSTAKSTKQGVQNFAKAAVTQITGSQSSAPQNDQGTNEASSTAAQQQMSDDDRIKFLQGLYGKKPNNSQQSSATSQQQQVPKPQQNVKTALGLNDSSTPQRAATPTETIKTAMGIPQASLENNSAPSATTTVKNALGIPEIGSNQKTPEELAKIEALRQQLHGQYYQDLTNPQKAPEENVTEKLEREDQEKKMADLETDKEKPPPLPATVKQGTGENVVGVSG